MRSVFAKQKTLPTGLKRQATFQRIAVFVLEQLAVPARFWHIAQETGGFVSQAHPPKPTTI